MMFQLYLTQNITKASAAAIMMQDLQILMKLKGCFFYFNVKNVQIRCLQILSDRQDSCPIKNVYVSVVMIYDIEVNDGPKGEICVSDKYFSSPSITL